MKAVPYRPSGRGPFRAAQIRPGDPYELSDGHAIVSEPSGRRHGRKHLVGGAVLATDPAVHRRGSMVSVKHSGESVAAPGVLRNAVPVDALYDRAAAHALMLRNLLDRAGYRDLDAVRAEGRAEGEALGRLAHARALLQHVLASRGLASDAAQMALIERCTELEVLDRWLDAALSASSTSEVLGKP